MMLLYEAESRGVALDEVIDAQVLDVEPAARQLAEGVVTHRAELDHAIAEHAREWTIERMPAIDRTVLRLGAFELAHRPEVPTAVVLDEAVELVNSYSTDNSGKFVNGLLGALVPVLRP